MCIHIWIYIYIYTHTSTHVYIYNYIYIHIHTCLCVIYSPLTMPWAWGCTSKCAEWLWKTWLTCGLSDSLQTPSSTCTLSPSIWVNDMNSLTLIKAIKGDDFPIKDQWFPVRENNEVFTIYHTVKATPGCARVATNSAARRLCCHRAAHHPEMPGTW